MRLLCFVKEAIITKLGIIPIAQQFIEELGIVKHIDAHIKAGDEEISHGKVINVLLLNMLDSPSPLYRVSDWLGDYTDGLGEFFKEAHKFHDKRLGATLDALYESDRHSLLSELSGQAIAVHKICTDVMHNDTTSITFIGDYKRAQAVGSEVVLTQGYNKDHRPDCKQIVFGLTVSADGYVPLLGQFYSGNKTDDQTHQVNWQALRELLCKEDFIYVADSKLCSTENLMFIAGAGGSFISILPATRKEVQGFYKVLGQITAPDSKDLPCNWKEVYRVKNSRKRGTFTVYRMKEGAKTKEGFRLLWVHSSTKAQQDKQRRAIKIQKAQDALEELKTRLNRYYLKTQASIQKAIDKALGKTAQFFEVELIAKEQVIKKQQGKGRPGPNTKWIQQTIITYEIAYALKPTAIKQAANKDGIFPLVTNTELEGVEVLKHYKNQPFLEKRFNTLKSVLEVAPVFLKKPERVEAMLFLYIIALMLVALIERKIRKNMETQDITDLPILPQGMKTSKPTWSNIKFCFNSVIMLSVLMEGEPTWKHQVKGISKHQQSVLKILDIEQTKYQQMTPQWWLSITDRGG